MEEGETPPLILPPHQNHSYFFPPTLLSSTSLQPPSLLQQQTAQESQTAPDIDWVSFLSSHQFGFADDPNKLTTATAALTTAGNGSEEEKGRKNKGKAISRMKKVSKPRFAFQTRSDDDILDDGYRWRKYGQKSVKNSIHPRSYYRCTHHTCNVKKQVQRLSKDTGVVVTTYEGIHNHPCEKLMECLAPLLKQMQFLSRF